MRIHHPAFLQPRTVALYISVGCLTLLQSCSSVRDSPKYQLGDDYYKFRQKGTKYQNTFVHLEDDTLRIISRPDGTTVHPVKNTDQYFLKQSFDIDVTTIIFKYRPAQPTLPRQLDVNFNGNLFIGHRLDRFRIKYVKTPTGMNKTIRHRAISAGVFGGLGSTSITPSTTNYQTNDEYNGLVLSRGFALMFGVNSLTVGMALGWDAITDRDRSIWIYQNQPWYGLSLGLNLN